MFEKSRMQELLSLSVKKPSKTAAMDALKSLIDQMPPSMYEDNVIAIGELVRFFTPPVPKKPKNDFQWCALAAGDNLVKEMLNYVYVVDEYTMVGCDGHRMHVAPNTENLLPGFWCPKTKVKMKELGAVKYPDYERLLHRGGRSRTDLKWQKESVKGRVSFVAETKGSDGGRYVFDLKYFEQALSFFTDELDWYPGSGSESALMVEGDRTAVLMPIRV